MFLRTSSTADRRRLVAVAAVGALLCVPLVGVAASATAATTPGPGGHETRPFEPETDGVSPDVRAPKSNAPSHVPAKNVPVVSGLPVSSLPGTGFDGLTQKDQRLANDGNSFSTEPPDQALCVGNGYVLEGVNNVFSIHTTAGTSVAGPQSYAPFWDNGTAEVVRHPDGTVTYGEFLSDPKCYYDPALGRFFMTELELGTDPSTGAFTGDSFIDIAVSRSSTPGTSASDWHLYQLNVRNDGTQGTPAHNGCPCFGDQPLIGADRYGFYITTNEYPVVGDGFNGAQIYAFDKAALSNGRMRVVRLESNGLPLAEGVAYSVQPATSPAASEWSTAAGGTEFFLSSLEFTGGFDNRVAAWSLTNTSSLTKAHPDIRLTNAVVGSEVYGMPPKVQQKAGPTPLADAVRAKEELIDSNDDRMNQAVYADGRLWSGVNTAVKTATGATTAGIAYFVVAPSVGSNGVSGRMDHQGYVAVNGNSVIFPSIGVRPDGRGVMVFSLSGQDYYPSAALVKIGSDGAVTGGVQVIGAGTAPDDGYSGYPAYDGTGVGRWGDYSAAVADASGKVWVSTEYVPGTFGYPDFIANWGTYVGAVTP